MLKSPIAVVLTLGVLLASGCSKPAPTINASMTQVMQPQAQTIWDITSKAFNDKGDGLEASKITDADWAQLAKAGDAEGAAAQVKVLGDACAACHRTYRAR